MEAFIEDLASMAADQYFEGKGPIIESMRAPMALAGPSDENGPCRGRCRHEACAKHRELAKQKCITCSKQLGYRRSFAWTPSGHAHTICSKTATETKDLQGVAKASDTKPQPKPEPATWGHEFMLPEYDIDVDIPHGRKPKPGEPTKHYRATAQFI